jgi:feruloyl esterase
MRILVRGCCAALFVATSGGHGLAAEQSCERLAALTLPHATITLAESVPAGQFSLPTGTPRPLGTPPTPRFNDLPAFCRVVATLTPSSDSDIKIEVWMPTSGWNGKFEAVGNGGWWGDIRYATLFSAVDGLSEALRRGDAASSTDTGHVGGSGSFVLGHPEKLTDFAYRAVHEMTVQAKSIITTFYGRPPTFSYFEGCSGGGRQALKEAQKYPSDFDGIVAGAPAAAWTHLTAQTLWAALATRSDPGSMIPGEKFQIIHDAVLKACDRVDGVKDGVLENPTQCHFDPAALLCQSADDPSCLTASQVTAVRTIYSDVKNPRTAQVISAGLERGSEARWTSLTTDPAPVLSAAIDHFKYVVFKDPAWDFRRLNLDTDVALADKLDAGLINATDPNLKPFVARGGRLIMFQGWGDHLVPPMNIVKYYNRVVTTLGPALANEAIRLFMVPGMGHCGGGEGTSSFDPMSAMEQWAERAKAPAQITASHVTNGLVDRTRPLCPYSQVAKYKGTGSTDNASNFICQRP